MIEFSFAREHVEIKHAERFARGRICDHIKLEIVNPFVGRGDPFEFQAENALIDVEHSIEHFLEGEIRAQSFLVDVVFLFVPLVVVVTPVPHHDFGVGIVCIGSLQFLEFRYFAVEFRLDAGNQIVDVLFRIRAGFGHFDFCLVVVPRFVTEAQRDLVPQGQHLVQNGHVCIFRQRFANKVKLFARRLTFRVFLNGVELPGDVCHHGINVVSGFNPRRGKKTIRQSIEIRLREHHWSVGLNDVGVEICSELG